ncbi:MAG: CPBP family intramembrane metalloprotease [Erysipelotrichaceae bacterium]|nr:CPBP family intramembrane metalloprotease [Erysipelotrichaceae bacterium]
MKAYFHQEKCPECEKYYDPTLNVCPHCGHQEPERRDFHAFEHHVHDSFIWQIVLFLIGFAGLQILGFLLAAILQVTFMATHPGCTPEEITQYLQSVSANFTASGVTYVIIFAIYFLIFGLRKRFKELFHSFAKAKNYLFGAIGGIAILGATMLYSLIINVILRATGFGEIGVNNNETAIRAITIAFPALSLIVFGFVGPLCEELAYRVGLFGFMSRLGKLLGYSISAMIFGLIHFNWNALGSGDANAIVVEFANLPGYVGSGLALAFLYDRFGLCSSYVAHAFNNVFSLSMTLIQGGAN